MPPERELRLKTKARLYLQVSQGLVAATLNPQSTVCSEPLVRCASQHVWQRPCRWSPPRITTQRDGKGCNGMVAFWSSVWVWLSPGCGQFSCAALVSSPHHEHNNANLM